MVIRSSQRLGWLAVICSTANVQAQVASSSVPSVAPVGVTAFRDVTVIPMDRDRMLSHQTILVQNDQIIALGPVKTVKVPATAVQVDGRGKFLIPGLADMHAHVNVFVYNEPFRGVPLGENPKRDSLAADYLFLYVANGVTTIRDVHSGQTDSPLLALRQRVAHREVLGPRIYTAGDPMAWQLIGSANTASFPPDSLDSLAQRTEALKAAGHDFVKLYGWRHPLYDTVVAAAARVGLRVAGHVPNDVGLLRVLQDRWASIEHLTGYIGYALGLPVGVDEREPRSVDSVYRFLDPAGDSTAWRRSGYRLDRRRLRRIAVATRRAGVWNCPTLTVTEGFGPASTNLRYQIVKALQDAGAGLILGTDPWTTTGPWTLLPGFTVHRELQLLVEAGLTPYQALATGTRNVAAFLGTLDSTGTITVGKRADLVLLNGNPLRDIRATTDLAGVMVGGHWLPRAAIDARLDPMAEDTVASFRRSVAQDRLRYWWR